MLAVDRARGCLLGSAIGDAMGAGIEFDSWTSIREKYGHEGVADFVPAYGRIGVITDDTQMMLFTAEATLAARRQLMINGNASLEDALVASYRRWLWTQGMSVVIGSHTVGPEEQAGLLWSQPELHARRAPGTTCLQALINDQYLAFRRSDGRERMNDSKGAGGIMRVAPLGIAFDEPDDAFAMGVIAARITHGHPTGFLTAGAFAYVLSALANDISLPDAISSVCRVLRQQPESGETLAAIEKAAMLAQDKTCPPRSAVTSLGEGWVAEEALAIALYCALVHDDFQTAVTVSVNHDGDSDTTGCLVGALLGMTFGESALPSSWLDRLELRDVITQVADALVVVPNFDVQSVLDEHAAHFPYC